ncbi:hypothetical protein [Haladaptatus sp. CMAA 1911]|uniref:hypothetical protein n=1 Tax=unclassified Haladaptatus TaxID=2622732 RepID=UPI003754B4E1
MVQYLHPLVLPAPIEREPAKDEFTLMRIVRNPDLEVLGRTVELACRDVEAFDRVDAAVSERRILADNPDVSKPDAANLTIHLVASRREVEQCITPDFALDYGRDVFLTGWIRPVLRHIHDALELSTPLLGVD